MAIWAQTDFTGGAVGTNVTTATEPIFSDISVTSPLTYQLDKLGAKGMQNVSTAAHGGIPMGGRTQARVAFNWYRVSGTQSSYVLLNSFRQGTTVLVDMSVRNAGGGQPGARINFAWTDQLLTDFIPNGQQWHIENHWIQGEGLHVYLWKDGRTAADPWDYHLFGPNTTYAPDNIRVGHSNIATGLTGVISGLRVTDGEAVWGTTPPPTSTLVYNVVGAPSPTGFTVSAKTLNTTSTRLVVSTNSGLTSPTYFGPFTPDADGYVKMVATGLSPGTRYYWATEHNSILNGDKRGQAKTTVPAADPATYKFITSSCHDWENSAAFGVMQTYATTNNIDFMVMLGDLGYPYTTAGGVPIAPSDIPTLRANREIYLATEAPMAFYRNIVTSYTYSDCDGAGANSDGTWPGFTSGSVQAAYRQQMPNPTLPLATSQARSWVAGGVRFIQTDELTMSSPRGATDDSSKSKLGTAQRAWFYSEIDAAVAANEVVAWLGDGPWVGAPSVGGTLQEWRAYNTERVAIGNYIQSSGVKLIRIHGDTHSLAADSGANNAYGGFPFISAAPFHTTAHAFGLPVDHGSYPSVTTNSARQFGEYAVTNTGDSLSIDFSGLAWNGSAYVEQVSMLTTWDLTSPTQMWTSVFFEGQEATEAWLNGQLIWSK